MENFHEIVNRLHENVQNHKNNVYTFRFKLKSLQARIEDFQRNLAASTARYHQTIDTSHTADMARSEMRKAG